MQYIYIHVFSTLPLPSAAGSLLRVPPPVIRLETSFPDARPRPGYTRDRSPIIRRYTRRIHNNIVYRTKCPPPPITSPTGTMKRGVPRRIGCVRQDLWRIIVILFLMFQWFSRAYYYHYYYYTRNNNITATVYNNNDDSDNAPKRARIASVRVIANTGALRK